MERRIIEDLLGDLRNAADREDAWAIVGIMQKPLLEMPDVAGKLVQSLIVAREKGDPEPVEGIALESMLTGARMDQENGGRRGRDWLNAAEAAIRALSKDMTAPGAIALSRCYTRAGLVPPDVLTESGWTENTPELSPTQLPDIDGLLEKLRDDVGGDAFALHAGFGEMLGALPAQVRAFVTQEVLSRGDPVYDRVGLYWLLDPAAHVRLAAAEAFLTRMRAGTLDAADASRLIDIRAWLPADEARETLDHAIREAMRREVSGGSLPKPWKLHRILGSIPDGAGAQSIVVAAQSPSGPRGIPMLLLKQGYGIKDAYVIPCSSASEQKRLIAGITEQVETMDLSREYLEFALTAALVEGHEIDTPPAPGLIDIAQIFGLTGLRPEKRRVADWIRHCDPDGNLSGLDAIQKGKLINAGASHAENFEIAESWYEDSDEVEDLMRRAITPASREKAMWKHLRGRTDWWALVFAKTAACLRAQGKNNIWRSFAATALAMEEGRPPPKIPLMRMIFERSLGISGNPMQEMFQTLRTMRDADGPEMSAIPFPETDAALPAAPTPTPEEMEELSHMLVSIGGEITPEWLDGYFSAIVVAPDLIKPTDWIGVILGCARDFENEAQMQRFLDLVVARYNAINRETADPIATRARFDPLRDEAVCDWAEGFDDAVKDFKPIWSSRRLKKEDKAVLGSITDIAARRLPPVELRKIVPEWLAARR